VACTLPDGTRYRRKHQNELEARKDRATLISTHGTSVTLEEIEQAKAAILALRNSTSPDVKGRSLLDAVNFFCTHFRDTSRVLPIGDYVAEFLAEKRKQDLRAPTLAELEKFLHKFAADFAGQNIRDIAKREVVETYLTKTHAPNRNRKAILNQFFNYLAQTAQTTNREFKVIEANPVRLMAHRRRQDRDISAIGILNAREVVAILKRAATYNAQRLFVWLLFTGMRPTETVKFWRTGGWGHINLGAGVINVNASISKTRTNRQIRIQPNLRAWLEHYRGKNFLTSNWRDKYGWTKEVLPEDRRTINDICRHTFISYLSRISSGWQEVELQAGNTKTIQLQHYLALVHDDPESFWGITPEKIGVFDVSEEEYAHKGYLNRRAAILENKKKVRHKKNGELL
jgi:hypothetical protein